MKRRFYALVLRVRHIWRCFYPLISLVTRAPQTLQGQSPLNFSCRNFRTFVLLFKQDTDSLAVFESVRELTVAGAVKCIWFRWRCFTNYAVSVSQLYAFFYVPNPPLTASNGWSIYSPKEEFARMGVGSRTKAWRFSNVNKDYTVGVLDLMLIHNTAS